MAAMKDPDPPTTALPLDDLLAGVLRAVVQAKSAMDDLSGELSASYRSRPGPQGVPYFGLAEANIQLRFAIQDAGTKGGLRVVADSTALQRLPAHLVSQIDVRLLGQPAKLYTPVEPEPRPIASARSEG